MGWISRRAWAALLVLVLVVMTTPSAWATVPPGFDENNDVWSTAVPAASCRPGDRVETGLQGEVPVGDRDSRRSVEGYACNIDLIGQYQGPGAGWTSAAYQNCVYIGSTFPHTDGVQVVDVSDPAHPRPTDVLREPAMEALLKKECL